MAVGDGPIDLDTIGVEQALGQWWFMGGLRLPWPMDDGDRNRSHPGLGITFECLIARFSVTKNKKMMVRG